MRFASPNCAFLGLLSKLASDVECVLCLNEGSLAIKFTCHGLWYMKRVADRVETKSSLMLNVGGFLCAGFIFSVNLILARTFKFCKGLQRLILKATACEDE